MESNCSFKTRSAFFWTYILNTPFWAIYHMLPFILYKDLGASAWQISLLIVLRPVVSIFSLYWSSFVFMRGDRLKSNVIWAGVVGHLPFFFALWIDQPWYYVAAGAVYMLTVRGCVPAWMEILKKNISSGSRQRLFAYASSLSYMGSALFPFFFGWLMDEFSSVWRWIFAASSILSLFAIVFQASIPLPDSGVSVNREEGWTGGWLLRPWRTSWKIVRNHPEFARFQIGFMLGGFGLMVIQPALPAFFTDTLFLSYKELGMALTLCKGIGYAATSSFWARLLNSVNIYRFISLVTLLATAFPLFLLASRSHTSWLYIAYLSYGIMQGGSEMGWKMSGPLFAKQQDSSPFSSVNVLMVGIRGAVAPFLGQGIFAVLGIPAVMAAGFVFSLLATLYMYNCSRRYGAEGSLASQISLI